MKKYIFFLFLVIFSWANAQIDEKIKFDVVKEFTQKFLEAQKDAYNHNDLKNYQKEIKPKLDTITSIAELEELLIKNDFKNTYENVVARLYDLNFNGERDDLAEEAKSLMKDKVDINYIYDSLNNFLDDVHDVEQGEHNELEESPAVEIRTENKHKIPWYMLVLLAIFILSTLALSVLYFRLLNEHKNRETEVRVENDNVINNLKSQIEELTKIKNKLQKELNEEKNKVYDTPIEVEQPVDKSDLETNLTIKEPTVEEVKEKYAPKLIGEGWDSLSDSPNNSTLYHLTKISEDKFSFKVYADLSQMVINDVTNFPDNTLYNACLNLNSNLEYKSSIRTTEEGIIVKRDNLYIVEEKAVIKFE